MTILIKNKVIHILNQIFNKIITKYKKQVNREFRIYDTSVKSFYVI